MDDDRILLINEIEGLLIKSSDSLEELITATKSIDEKLDYNIRNYYELKIEDDSLPLFRLLDLLERDEVIDATGANAYEKNLETMISILNTKYKTCFTLTDFIRVYKEVTL